MDVLFDVACFNLVVECLRCASSCGAHRASACGVMHGTSTRRDHGTTSSRVHRANAGSFLCGVSSSCIRRTSASGRVRRASAWCVIRDTSTRRDHTTSTSSRVFRAAPAVSYVAPAPAVYSAPVPVLEYIVPAPAVSYAAPAVIEAPVPVLEVIAPTPKWEVYLSCDKTVKVERDSTEVLTRDVPPPGIGVCRLRSITQLDNGSHHF